jgi:arylsulfatase
LKNEPLNRSEPLFFEHERSRAVRDGNWKLVSLRDDEWELYDLNADPTEMNNLMAREPAKARELIALWQAWAARCGVEVGEGRGGARAAAASTPQIADRPLTIRCDVETDATDGVILAQGGREHGYALHLKDGKVIFTVRIDGKAATAIGTERVAGKFSLLATLRSGGAMTLAVNRREVAKGQAAGLISKQPQDGLSIGEDARTAVGDYAPPHPLRGTVRHVQVETKL